VDNLPGCGTALWVDVAGPEASREVAGHAAGIGDVRVWVCSADVLFTAAADEISDQEVRRQVDVNLPGVIHDCRAALEVMWEGVVVPGIVGRTRSVPGPGGLRLDQGRRTELLPAWRGVPLRASALVPVWPSGLFGC
jgi:NAD(P)-dependent dehydrogenase (short-subunit alcohol dehydrogenase family)